MDWQQSGATVKRISQIFGVNPIILGEAWLENAKPGEAAWPPSGQPEAAEAEAAVCRFRPGRSRDSR
jgi:transposase-like protein